MTNGIAGLGTAPDSVDNIGLGNLESGTFDLIQYRPPDYLGPYIRVIFFFCCDRDELIDSRPATSGNLTLVIEGEGKIRLKGEESHPIYPATLIGPGTMAGQFHLKGPVRHIGIGLTPLGLVALTGKAADHITDSMIDARTIFGEDIVNLLDKIRSLGDIGARNHAAVIGLISEFIGQNLRPIPQKHRIVITAMEEWLSSTWAPDVADLYARLDMSRSTASRLISRYYGSAPKAIMRKTRAVRAAAALCEPGIPSDIRQNIESAFYDQPHMIREIRHFVGHTPGSLSNAPDRAIKIWFAEDNYHEWPKFAG